MKKVLNREQAEAFKRKLQNLSFSERRRVESNFQTRDDGGIDILNAAVIASVASSLLDDSDHHSHSDDFEAGGGDFGGAGASGSYESSDSSSSDSGSSDSGSCDSGSCDCGGGD